MIQVFLFDIIQENSLKMVWYILHQENSLIQKKNENKNSYFTICQIGGCLVSDIIIPYILCYFWVLMWDNPSQIIIFQKLNFEAQFPFLSRSTCFQLLWTTRLYKLLWSNGIETGESQSCYQIYCRIPCFRKNICNQTWWKRGSEKISKSL